MSEGLNPKAKKLQVLSESGPNNPPKGSEKWRIVGLAESGNSKVTLLEPKRPVSEGITKRLKLTEPTTDFLPRASFADAVASLTVSRLQAVGPESSLANDLDFKLVQRAFFLFLFGDLFINLDKLQQEILDLVVWGRMTISEASKHLNLPRATVSDCYKSALASLRR
jgi:hypothetical protein